MEGSWDADEDDLEKLLEFDNVDAEFAPRPEREVPSARPSAETVATPLEVGCTRTDPGAGSPKQTAEQNTRTAQGYGGFQVGLDGCCEVECDVDLRQTSAGIDGGCPPLPSSKRGRDPNDEDAGLENPEIFRRSSMHRELTANQRFSKQTRVGSVLEDLHGIERTERDSEVQVGISLGEIEREKRASGGTARRNLNSSKDTEYQARRAYNGDRSRESECNGEDQEPRRNSSGAAQDGRSSQVVVSLSSGSAREAADNPNCRRVPELNSPHRLGGDPSETGVSPPISEEKHRIPGPAGALQNWLRSNRQNSRGVNCDETSVGPSVMCDRALGAANALDFRDGPWLAAMEYLKDGQVKNGHQSLRSTIVTIKATNRHIPQVVAVITAVVPNGFGDVSVSLKDPTGAINGSIHRTVLTDLDGGELIAPGAVIILRKVAVFSPTPYVHYLNITLNNVVRIFGKNTVAVRAGASGTSGIIGSLGRNHHFVSQRELNNESRLPRGSQLEHAFHGDQGVSEAAINRQRRMQSYGISESLPKRGCSQPIPTGANNPPQSSANMGALDQTRCPTASNAPEVDTRDINNPVRDCQPEASQEAIAKAAGWDFSEDFELLVEDFPLANF